MADTPQTQTLLERCKHLGWAVLGISAIVCLAWIPFSQEGRVLQGRVLGLSYQPVDAVVTKTAVTFDPRGKQAVWAWAFGVSVDYAIEGHRFSGNLAAITTWPNVDDGNKARAYKETDPLQEGAHLTVYADPKNPKEIVLHPEDEPHLWFNILVFTPLAALLCILSIVQIVILFSKQNPFNTVPEPNDA